MSWGFGSRSTRRPTSTFTCPAGAIPKGRAIGQHRDGHRAGLSPDGRPAYREVAITGEITLRGRVLPVGGVREKVIGAHRAGIKTFVLPRDNLKDLGSPRGRPPRADLRTHVDRMEDVLPITLHPPAAELKVV